MKANSFLIVSGLLVLLLTTYTAFWFWMAGEIRKEMDALPAEAAKNGVQIVPGAMGVRGYPLIHEAWFSGSIAADGTVIEVPLLEARSFFLPQTPLSAEMPQGFNITHPADASVWSPNYLLVQTVIPKSFPEFFREDLAAWRDAGNRIVFGNIELGKNSLRLKGNGHVLLDANLQPAGEFNARITGHMDFLAWLQQQNHIETRDALIATAVLSGLSKTDPASNELYMEAALMLQNRMLFVGPLRLASLPPVVWASRNLPALPE